MMTWNSIFFHSPNSNLMESVIYMYDYLTMILASILLMVIINMTYTLMSNKFNLEFYENHQLESVWTFVPFLILMFIIAPSLKSLYMLDSCFFCGLTISIIGHQWYWSYSMSESQNYLNFDSYMSTESDNKLRLIDVDNRLVVPNNLPIRFLLSSSDVIHSWTVPSLGVKMDAIPGRINQFCVTPKRTGVYFGQCSEICGMNHSFMPIVVESLNLKDFFKMM